MSDNKPPMTVWLNHGDAEHEPPWHELDYESITWSEQPTGMDFGPYILKDWLKAELLKRAKGGMRGYESPEKYFMELGRAVRELFQELNGGKNEL